LPSFLSSRQKRKKIRPSLLLHTGGGWKYRWWPNDRWRALIQKLKAEGDWELGILVGPGDEEQVAQITRNLQIAVETPKVKDLLKLVQEYDLFVGTDSGPLHLAVLSGIPAVDLMGPGDPVLWAPPPGTGILLQDVLDYDCHPCIQKKCIYPNNPCIERIALSQVLAAIGFYLKKLRSGASGTA
jgi:ADP-heptose:LPS heptosyltransferase